MFFAIRFSFVSRRHAASSGWAASLLACMCSAGGTAFAVTLPPTVVVTATRIETPLSEVIAPTLVIDRDTIERSGANDAGELLRFHAGLDMGRNGGPGQPTAVFIRGAESNHTLVLIDGIRINPGTIGLPPLQNIPPDMIERIEIIKGPRSALWGTDAIGGVINVITRRGSRDGWSTEVGYGDYDTRKASLNGGFDAGSRGHRFWRFVDRQRRIPDPHVRRRRSRLRQPERKPAGALRRRTGATGLPVLAYRRQFRVLGFFPGAGGPGLRIVDGGRGGRVSRFVGDQCAPHAESLRGSHRAEPIDRFPAHGSRLARRPGGLAGQRRQPARGWRHGVARESAQLVVRRPVVRRYRYDHGLRAGSRGCRPAQRAARTWLHGPRNRG